jgi:hypothetical protein
VEPGDAGEGGEATEHLRISREPSTASSAPTSSARSRSAADDSSRRRDHSSSGLEYAQATQIMRSLAEIAIMMALWAGVAGTGEALCLGEGRLTSLGVGSW